MPVIAVADPRGAHAKRNILDPPLYCNVLPVLMVQTCTNDPLRMKLTCTRQCEYMNEIDNTISFLGFLFNICIRFVGMVYFVNPDHGHYERTVLCHMKIKM